MIQISKVDLGDTAAENVLAVLQSGRLAQGPFVEQLEAGFCEIADTQHAIAVMSGTVALVAAIEGLQLEPGDEVVTSPFTFVASVNAILEAGATVRFADIGDDYCLDPAGIEAVITDRTKAVMPVHLYGLTAEMGPIMEITERHSLGLVEDAAQAHMAEWGGQRAGSFGIGCFSLYATKNITSGEGGVVTTNDDELADRLRVLRNQGMRARYEYEMVGHNWRMTELQAAVCVSQLPMLAERTKRRAANAAYLNEHLADVAGLILPSEPQGRRHAWHQYTVQVTEEAPVSREEFADALAANGVGSGIYYPKTAFDYDCYRAHDRVIESSVPVAERAARSVLSLPVHPFLTEEELATSVSAVRTAIAGS
ncbi:MAG: DegT/DnrJ/EryC1/StrS family aminotransferase [Acidimicrobiales bacterium]|jgi:perosamine synthetase|nr:DegT/DnrJ/EryC1/StrS family aminotransferase [Acidimicrobiales bacterium]